MSILKLNVTTTRDGNLSILPKGAATPDALKIIRVNKPVLVAAGGRHVLIFDTEAESTATIERWNVHVPDGPLSVWYVDGATLEKVEADYPAATAIEPWVESVDIPVATSPTCEAFEERAAIMEFGAGAPRHEAERLAAQDVGCITCAHFARPGLSAGYCGGRDDLAPAYGAGHPLRKLPGDRGASCKEWTGST